MPALNLQALVWKSVFVTKHYWRVDRKLYFLAAALPSGLSAAGTSRNASHSTPDSTRIKKRGRGLLESFPSKQLDVTATNPVRKPEE